MKATFITSEYSAELILENGQVFRSKAQESSEDFYVRIANKIDEELLDLLEISEEITEQKLNKLPLDALSERLPGARQLETEIIQNILKSKDAPKAPKVTSNRAGTGEPKPSEEQVLQWQKEGKANKGKTVFFTSKNADGEILEGSIRGLQTDKRVNFVYYRILVEGKPYHKKVGSKDLRIV